MLYILERERVNGGGGLGDAIPRKDEQQDF